MKLFRRLKLSAIEAFYGLKHFHKDDYFVISIGDYVVVPTNYQQASDAFLSSDAMIQGTHTDFPMNLDTLREFSMIQHAAKLEHFSRLLESSMGYQADSQSKYAVELRQTLFAEAESLNQVAKTASEKRTQVLDNKKPLVVLRVPLMKHDTGYCVEINDKVFPYLDSKDLRSIRLPISEGELQFNYGSVICVYHFRDGNKKLERRLYGLHKLLNKLVVGVAINPTLVSYVVDYICNRVPGYQKATVVHRYGENAQREKMMKYLRDYDLHVRNVFQSKKPSEDDNTQAWAMTQSVLDKVSKKTS